MDKTDKEQSISISQKQIYSGPVPDPDALSKYEKIHPGFADRLIKMAEKEQESRISSQKILVELEGEISRKELYNFKRGQIFALISVIFVILLCAYAFSLGYKNEGRDVAVAVIIGLAGIFITGRFIKKKQKP